MSINLLLDHETDPVLWRGPIIAGAVSQFWTDVIWENVDYLFVDMPPGTGDVVSDMFAEAIAKKLGATVTVVCGIHYEEPGKEGIETILERTRSLLDEVINSI